MSVSPKLEIRVVPKSPDFEIDDQLPDTVSWLYKTLSGPVVIWPNDATRGAEGKSNFSIVNVLLEMSNEAKNFCCATP